MSTQAIKHKNATLFMGLRCHVGNVKISLFFLLEQQIGVQFCLIAILIGVYKLP